MSETIKERVTLSLRCQLTPDELRERGDRLAELLDERDRIDADLVMARQRAKSEHAAIEPELGDLRSQIKTRHELREVDCEVRFDFSDGKAYTVRTDTGEIVRSRALTHDERQGNLFEIDGRPGAAVATDPSA